ncbi:vesicle transport through interaction with t-SNAREs homolog 1A isoform X2 [Plutella xylostella]|uniref:vesicle transport through interaction with t-SNAREs homolog 1A isoform X1 n=1 Tax=Plutella xylostella TaxID=51655 RepID=UPI0020330BDA|nr:vesicle transport through interaction with t-SNAREs homolog 1A isoform X1 [Plutella xylostella]XP_048482204.1 vesicle transport through interaction with t-SNAREs homolog 1A isoform X2 [Plutella xylostella]
MATLIQSYEQQYAVLTAEITSKIGRLKVGNEDIREQLSKEIQANFEEANDLLEQLELESRGAAGAGSGGRTAAFRAELLRVREEFRKVLSNSAAYNIDEDMSYEDWGPSSPRQQLLDNSERLERTGRSLTDGYRVLLETERVGAEVLRDLSGQRETVQRARGRLRETDEQLSRSARLMNSMVVRGLQARLALALVFVALGLLATAALYYSVT